MNTTSRRAAERPARWLRRAAWGTAVAAALATAGTALAAPDRAAERPQVRMAHAGHAGGMGMMGAGGPGMGRMFERVGVSDEQRAQIERISQAARADMEAQREAARALHEQWAALFAQPAVDANAAEALRQQMVAQHDQASQRRMQTMLEISAVLTPEQRAQLAELRAERADRMGQRKQGQEGMGMHRPQRGERGNR